MAARQKPRKRSRRYPPSRRGLDEAGMLEYFAATHLKHAGNKPEWYGKPFFLESWQRDYIWNPIFATGKTVGKGEDARFVRRYRSALVMEPRDWGKTELAAAMVLSESNVHPVWMGQYGIIAYDEPQARKILATLAAMIHQDPDLNALWDTGKKEIVNRETGAVIKVFPYSPGAIQSWHFNMLVADELHVWRDNSVWNAIVSGMGNVENSLIIAITTAAAERSGFLWDWIAGSEDITSVFEDPNAYCVWFGADDADNPDERSTWRKVCLPSWVKLDTIAMQRKRLSKTNFERYILNRFPVEKEPDRSMRPRDISACVRNGDGFDFEQPFVLGVDGATSGDTFAIVAHQSRDGQDFFHEWIYDRPGERGYYDLNQIEGVIAGLAQKYHCAVGIDPARLLLMAQQLQDDFGIEIYEVQQSNKIMCPACSILQNSVRSHKCHLGGTPKLAEHLKNCRDLEREPYGVRWTSNRHGQGTERIDAAIAAAIAKWMTQTMPEELSFADTGGIWTLPDAV